MRLHVAVSSCGLLGALRLLLFILVSWMTGEGGYPPWPPVHRHTEAILIVQGCISVVVRPKSVSFWGPGETGRFGGGGGGGGVG